jgi:hypothetical protein
LGLEAASAATTKDDMMSDDKVPNPVSGNPASKGAPDGVSGVPGGAEQREIHGRSAGGESGGGAYPNPHTGKTPDGGGFMGHGGQTEIAYHGSGQAGEDGASVANAATGSREGANATDDAGDAVPTADRRDHAVAGADGAVTATATDGVAEAETSGKIGTDADYEAEQRKPGAG